MDDEPPIVDPAVDSVTKQFLRDGVDTQFLSEPFLEASEVGDADSLRHDLAGLSGDELRRRVKAVDQHGASGLMLAARRGDADVVDVLLGAGANPNDADSTGVTALHHASSRGSVAIIDSLLQACAEVNKSDDNGDLPLMWAVGARAIHRLLEARADAHATNKAGKTALMQASGTGNAGGIEALARVPGTDLDLCDKQGLTAHAIATAADDAEAGGLLAGLGATATVIPSRILLQEEALHEAARQGQADVCLALLGRGGMSVDTEVAGETALLLAAGGGHERAVEALLGARADPNHPDAFLRETPLVRAVLSRCSNELLWLLLEARADPSRADLVGRTPADHADAWGLSDSVALLNAAARGELDLVVMD